MQDSRIALVEKPQLKKDDQIPSFKVGDTVIVHVKVIDQTKDGKERIRLQAFQGVVLARKNAGFNSSFTVRKISSGFGVERVFPIHSPIVERIEVVRRGVVRQSKIYYMRELSGKSARIKERLN